MSTLVKSIKILMDLTKVVFEVVYKRKKSMYFYYALTSLKSLRELPISNDEENILQEVSYFDNLFHLQNRHRLTRVASVVHQINVWCEDVTFQETYEEIVLAAGKRLKISDIHEQKNLFKRFERIFFEMIPEKLQALKDNDQIDENIRKKAQVAHTRVTNGIRKIRKKIREKGVLKAQLKEYYDRRSQKDRFGKRMSEYRKIKLLGLSYILELTCSAMKRKIFLRITCWTKLGIIMFYGDGKFQNLIASELYEAPDYRIRVIIHANENISVIIECEEANEKDEAIWVTKNEFMAKREDNREIFEKRKIGIFQEHPFFFMEDNRKEKKEEEIEGETT